MHFVSCSDVSSASKQSLECGRNVPDERQTEMIESDVVFRGSRLASKELHFSSLHCAISLPEPIKCFSLLPRRNSFTLNLLDQRGAELWCSSTRATQMDVSLLHAHLVDVLNDPYMTQFFLPSSSISPAGSIGWSCVCNKANEKTYQLLRD